MATVKCALLFLLLIQSNLVAGRRYSPQQNSDFLQHEVKGYNVNYDKVNEQSNFEEKNYESQFPALGPTRKDHVTPNLQNGGRDYVNPNYTPIKPNQPSHNQRNTGQLVPSKYEKGSPDTQSPLDKKSTVKPSGGRDYVNPNYKPSSPSQPQEKDNNPGHHQSNYAAQFPPLGPQTAQLPPLGPQTAQLPPLGPQTAQLPPLGPQTAQLPPLGPQTSSKPSGNRDYVNPNYPQIKPQPGKVKDLINFYDDKSKDKSTTKVPSYSTTLQGQNNDRKTPSKPPPKNPSFSSVLAGQTKPASALSTLGPIRPGTTAKSPATPVLPSSIVNSNKNSQNSGSNSLTDTELQLISEELLKKDVNNAAKYVTVNYQDKTTSQSKDDKAPQPLLSIGSEVWNIPTVQKFVPLLDNYERDTLVNEYVTPQERNEENAFMDVIMSTSVIRYLMSVLKDKGYVTPDPKQQRDFLKLLWFGLYSRGKGKISSSGFEHVFVSELKNNEVSGLHNWIYFSKEESANRINYLGYLKYSQLNDKGAVLKLHFNQQGVDKPVDTMFIGTSPELEIALYTLCFVTRADNDCNLKLAQKDVNIVTHTFRYRSKNMIGSAYPQI